MLGTAAPSECALDLEDVDDIDSLEELKPMLGISAYEQGLRCWFFCWKKCAEKGLSKKVVLVTLLSFSDWAPDSRSEKPGELGEWSSKKCQSFDSISCFISCFLDLHFMIFYGECIFPEFGGPFFLFCWPFLTCLVNRWQAFCRGVGCCNALWLYI